MATGSGSGILRKLHAMAFKIQPRIMHARGRLEHDRMQIAESRLSLVMS